MTVGHCWYSQYTTNDNPIEIALADWSDKCYGDHLSSTVIATLPPLSKLKYITVAEASSQNTQTVDAARVVDLLLCYGSVGRQFFARVCIYNPCVEWRVVFPLCNQRNIGEYLELLKGSCTSYTCQKYRCKVLYYGSLYWARCIVSVSEVRGLSPLLCGCMEWNLFF